MLVWSAKYVAESHVTYCISLLQAQRDRHFFAYHHLRHVFLSTNIRNIVYKLFFMCSSLLQYTEIWRQCSVILTSGCFAVWILLLMLGRSPCLAVSGTGTCMIIYVCMLYFEMGTRSITKHPRMSRCMHPSQLVQALVSRPGRDVPVWNYTGLSITGLQNFMWMNLKVLLTWGCWFWATCNMLLLLLLWWMISLGEVKSDIANKCF